MEAKDVKIAKMESSWSELVEEILEDIARRLTDLEDAVRFRAVCKSWQSIRVWRRKPLMPCLMLAEKDGNSKVRRLFSLSTGKIYQLWLPQAQGNKCIGSPYGWLLTVGSDLKMHLLNPFASTKQILLPSQPKREPNIVDKISPFPSLMADIHVTKFALSCMTPSSQHTSCLIVVIFTPARKLALATIGDQSWTYLEGDKYNDVIFFQGKFYVLDWYGALSVCDVNAPHPKLINIVTTLNSAGGNFYLVEKSGDLHMVSRARDLNSNAPGNRYQRVTFSFQVYKLDSEAKRWGDPLDDLGDHALFLGLNTSFSISTSDYPQFRRNSIYFTDDYVKYYKVSNQLGRDTGIYDYGKGVVEPIYLGDDMLSEFSAPFFFMPSID